MTNPSPIQDVADTAHWVALYRAHESERPDAHFRDPFARQLAGPRGEEIFAALPKSMRDASWSVVARTVVVDRYVEQLVADGVTLILNLAAGLDSRPYRMALPPTLTWVEVDQAALLDEKEARLADAVPTCRLERVRLDLSQAASRRELFRSLGARGERTLVITEGLVMYLDPDEVAALARDLAAIPAFEAWVTDIISPGLLRMIDKEWGQTLRAGGAPMKFAPREAAAFFEPFGWHAAECHSAFTTARRLKRLPWLYRVMAFLIPGAERYQPDRPWSGICLLTRPRG